VSVVYLCSFFIRFFFFFLVFFHVFYSTCVIFGTTLIMFFTGRKYGWPLDRSTLYTSVTKFTEPKQITERLQSGCFVQGVWKVFLRECTTERLIGKVERGRDREKLVESDILKIFFLCNSILGLYLEGAAWDLDNQCLMPPRPKQLIQDLPILQVIPIEVCLSHFNLPFSLIALSRHTN
jgi:dynein heavy chain